MTTERKAAEARVRAALEESSALFSVMAESMNGQIAKAAEAVRGSLARKGTLYCCGNGGSAADAQHIAAELGGKFYRIRPGLPAVALTVNSSMVTAIGNDFGYDEVFSRQVEGLGRKGDVLLAITTSGNSMNVVRAAELARTMKITVIGLTGAGGGKLAAHCDHLLAVPSRDTARIQEAHIAIGHLLCEIAEAGLFPDAREPVAQARRPK